METIEPCICPEGGRDPNCTHEHASIDEVTPAEWDAASTAVRERDHLSDIMLEPARQRERERRGSELAGDERYRAITGGDPPAYRKVDGTWVDNANSVQLNVPTDDFDGMAAEYGFGPDTGASQPGYEEPIDPNLESVLFDLCNDGIYISWPHKDGICRISKRSVSNIRRLQHRHARLLNRLATILEDSE